MKLGAITVNFLLNQQEGRTLVGVMKVKRLTTALVIHRAKPSEIFWREELRAKSLFAEEYQQKTVHDNVVKSPLIQYKRRGNCKGQLY